MKCKHTSWNYPYAGDYGYFLQWMCSDATHTEDHVIHQNSVIPFIYKELYSWSSVRFVCNSLWTWPQISLNILLNIFSQVLKPNIPGSYDAACDVARAKHFKNLLFSPHEVVQSMVKIVCQSRSQMFLCIFSFFVFDVNWSLKIYFSKNTVQRPSDQEELHILINKHMLIINII